MYRISKSLHYCSVVTRLVNFSTYSFTSLRRLSSHSSTKYLPISYLNTLPKNNINNSWELLNQAANASEVRYIVLDDDPTGCQTVYNVNVLLKYDIENISNQLKLDEKVFYILTNTRAQTEEYAIQTNTLVLNNINTAIKQINYKKNIRIISRSDSTLRGHYPNELIPLFNLPLYSLYDAIILIPCFFDGGRVTVNDIHYVIEKSKDDNNTSYLVPCALTPFAKDAHFGYKYSNLKQWIEEKTNGNVCAIDVISITIEDIRIGGVDRVYEKLLNITGKKTVIVNAVEQDDLNIVALAILKAENMGKMFIYRTAASFVASIIGLIPKPLLTTSDIIPSQQSIQYDNIHQSDNNNIQHGGLVVMGSYVTKSSIQLDNLTKNMNIQPIEFNVQSFMMLRKWEREYGTSNNLHKISNFNESYSYFNDIVHEHDRYIVSKFNSNDIISQLSTRITELITSGIDVVLYTSRTLLKNGSILDYTAISDALTEIVKQLQIRPRFIIGKGGITSHDVALKGLSIDKARVIGQVLPGVPVWSCHTEHGEGLRYVVFPGNVGDDFALAEVAEKLGVQPLSNLHSTRALNRHIVDSKTETIWSTKKCTNTTISIVSAAHKDKRAIASFNVYNIEGAKAVISAAEELQSPVILQIHPASLKFSGYSLLSALNSMRLHASVPVSLHLDHCCSEEELRMAILYGVNSVMADGSHLTLEDNIRWTSNMAHIAHSHGVAIEAELGKLAGEEDGLSVPEKEARMTDPECIVEYISRTKVDLLAVTVGNVHGKYKSDNPQLDWNKLQQINNKCLTLSVPPLLVLHGASGLSKDVINRAMDMNICKFNVNTDMRDAAITAIRKSITSNTKIDLLDLMNESTNAMKSIAMEKIRLFGRLSNMK